MRIEQLGPEHRALLASFRCATGGRQPWTQEVERMICEVLADDLARSSSIHAVGSFDEGELVGVAAWDSDDRSPKTWEIAAVAVASGWKQRGPAGGLTRIVLVVRRVATLTLRKNFR